MNSLTENIRHQTTEQELIQRIQQGNTESFAKLYDKYSPVLLGVILKIAPDKKVAEDILQKSFMRFWMEIGSFDPMKESLLMWMLTITRNTAFSAVPQKVKAEEIRIAGNSVNTINPAITPDKPGTFIDSLQIGQKNSALEMIYFKGYSLDLTARELNITVDELKTRIRMEFKLHGGMKSNG